MVVASHTLARGDRVRALGVPVIDLSQRRGLVSELIVRACEEFGFFMVVNHGVPDRVISRMEAKASDFFALPVPEKQLAGPASPLGYGRKNIGSNGDTGEVEYLLLHCNPTSLSQRARTISRKDPAKFSGVVNEYVDAVRELACDILELVAEGLGLGDVEVLSRPVKDERSDSLVRMNHYPSCSSSSSSSSSNSSKDGGKGCRVGFGEHTDPQILTVLRSNDVPGLQILSPSGGEMWIPVPSDPTAFCINVGDVLQAMTNGRLLSVRHRAIVNSHSSRMSLMYFAAPPLNAWVAPLPEMITLQSPCRYKPFTWAEYKKAMYALRLANNRLDLFRVDQEGDDDGSSFMEM